MSLHARLAVQRAGEFTNEFTLGKCPLTLLEISQRRGGNSV
jgi:hypothetical protein